MAIRWRRTMMMMLDHHHHHHLLAAMLLELLSVEMSMAVESAEETKSTMVKKKSYCSPRAATCVSFLEEYVLYCIVLLNTGRRNPTCHCAQYQLYISFSLLKVSIYIIVFDVTHCKKRGGLIFISKVWIIRKTKPRTTNSVLAS